MRMFALLSLSLCGLLLAGCGETASPTGSPDAPAAGSSGNGASAGTGEAKHASSEPASEEPASEESAGDSQSVALNAENTTIEFVGSKPDGSSHTGGFRDFSGKIQRGPEGQTIKAVSLEIQTKSLWADNKKLENHLKSPDFFKVREHPTATFQSTSVEAGESGEQTVTGELTLLGETKEISFPATVTAQDDGWKLESSFSLDRTRFGMTFGEGEINKEVELSVSVDTSGGEKSAGAKESGSEKQP